MTAVEPGEVTVRDVDGYRWIELHRPASRNGLTVPINQALIAAFDGAGDARAIVLYGAGGAFCSGLDLKAALRAGPRPPAELEADLRQHFHGLIRAVRGAPQPTIAVIDGPAVGFGCDLALACDLRIASDRARLGEIFAKRGLMADGGGTWMLPRLIGVGRALELLYTGDLVDAATAERIGLVNRVVAAADLVTEGAALARRIAAGPPLVHRLTKRAVYDGLASDLDAGLDREAAGQLQCLGSRDFVEGVTAFLGKRDPIFRGD